MLLYKYRPLSRLERLLDIVINERLYCPKYDDLNDPFEGIFLSAFPEVFTRPGSMFKVPQTKIHHRVDSLTWDAKKTRVASLSATATDVRMWSLYAEDCKGCAIEIDFSDYMADVREVQYQESLPEFTLGLLGMPSFEEALSKKTSHWGYECEYRHITDQVFYFIKNRIRRILVGPRAGAEQVSLLRNVIGSRIPLQETKLDFHSVTVIPTSDISETLGAHQSHRE
jgi:hypothetical protein